MSNGCCVGAEGVSNGCGVGAEGVSNGCGVGAEGVSNGCGVGAEGVSNGCGVGAEGVSNGCGVGAEGVSNGGGGEVASASKSFTHKPMFASATPPVSPSPPAHSRARSVARTKISENNVVNIILLDAVEAVDAKCFCTCNCHAIVVPC